MKPLQISYCPSAITEYQKNTATMGWKKTSILSLHDFRDLATSGAPYSQFYFRDELELPMIVDKHKKRRKESQRLITNVIGIAPVAIFDIDDGMRISEAEEKLNKSNIDYVIITTKSHGKEKANGEDRFRVFVPLQLSKVPSFSENGILLSDKDRDRIIQTKELKYLYQNIAKELNIFENCDPSALVDIARKYMPSPNNAKFIVQDTGNSFKMDSAAALAVKQAKEEMEIKKARLETSRENKQSLLSYDGLKKNKYKSYVDLGLLYSLDLAEIIYYYETKDEGSEPTRFYTETSYVYVHNKSHKYSIIFNGGDKGEYVFKDFKTGEAGNIVTYMREKLGCDASLFEIASILKNDFKGDLKGLDLIKTNPAYYIEPFRELLKSDDFLSFSNLKNNYCEKMDVKSVSITKKGTFVVEKNNGYKEFLKIDETIKKDFKKELDNFFKKKDNPTVDKQVVEDSEQENVIKP